METGSDVANEAYIFQPLASDKHIRLMHLEPSVDPSTDLYFSFLEAQCDEVEGDYEALSYTWGEPCFEFALFHTSDQERPLPITANLDAALRRLRHKHDIRLLWVDAVCINQKDEKEKSTQIPLMADIYRGASRVVAWLGPVGRQSTEEQGMRVLGTLSRHQDSLDEYIQQDNHSLGNHCPFCQGLCFLDLSWFGRLWIIQEITLNIDVLLLCGSYQLSWARFAAAIGILQEKFRWNSSLPAKPKISTLKTTIDLWLQQGIEHTGLNIHPFTEIIERYRDFGCADDRDRIFALYNVPGHHGIRSFSERSSKSTVINMPIDYDKTVDETYRTFTLACLKVSRPKVQPWSARGIMDSWLLRQYASQDSLVPSWSVDWRKRPAYPLRYPADSKFKIMYYGYLHPNMIKIAVNTPRFGYSEVTHKIERSAFTDVDHFLLAVAEAFSERNRVDGKHKVDNFASCLKTLLQGYWPNPKQSGPIPCPALLDDYLKDVFERHGAGVSNVSEDFKKVQEDVEEVTKQLCFFQSSSPSRSLRFIGLGNDKLNKDDRILSILSTVSRSNVWDPGYKAHIALILRHMRTLGKDTIREGEYDESSEAHSHSCLEEDATTGAVGSYRLIGSAMTTAPKKLPERRITRAFWLE